MSESQYCEQLNFLFVLLPADLSPACRTYLFWCWLCLLLLVHCSRGQHLCRDGEVCVSAHQPIKGGSSASCLIIAVCSSKPGAANAHMSMARHPADQPLENRCTLVITLA